MISYEVGWGGQDAITVLCKSGLLDQVDFTKLPIGARDILRIAGYQDGWAVVAYEDGLPIGYAVGSMFDAHRGQRHFHLSQIWTRDNRQAWKREALEYLENLATIHDCTHVAATVEHKVSRLMRRHGFVTQGFYMTKRIDRAH